MDAPQSSNRPTDHVNLDLNKFNLDVVFGRANGKIIWQPRIGCWFTDKEWAEIPFPEPYTGMSHAEIYRSLGCSDRLYNYFNPCLKRDEPGITRSEEWVDETHLVSTAKSPVGAITYVARTSPNNSGKITEKWWIETPEDMKVATWILENSGWAFDQDLYDKSLSQVGDLGAPTIYMPRVNVQDLYIDTMGVEQGIYAIYEWGSVVDDYFRALHQNHMRLIEVINSSPIMIVNFGDNLHCSTLSPTLYEEYVQPAYHERCNKLHEAGKFVNSHWDGDVRSLLKYAKTSGLDGIEALTPKPQGDVTLEEIKEALGDDLYYLDGIPAILFDTTFSEEELIAYAERVIELFAPKLVLGISDEISSTGDIERVRIVGRIVDDYNASLK